MLNLVVFETEEELCELTGLTEDELWQKGFNLDNWEIGFQSEVKLHKTPTKKDIENGYRKNELIVLNSFAGWLFFPHPTIMSRSMIKIECTFFISVDLRCL